MADEHEKAAIEAGAAALHQSGVIDVHGKQPRHYAMEVRVFEDCWSPTPAGPGEPEPAPGGESMSARLDRIEAQLQRVLELLDKRGA